MIFRTIAGCSQYQVSGGGVVQSRRRGSWQTLTGHLRKDGYRCYVLVEDSGRLRYSYGHDLVMLTFQGPTPPGKEVCFRDGDRSDCRLENLYFGRADRRRKRKVDWVTWGAG
jgi:hypothetical protein